MSIRIKRLTPNAVMPVRAHDGDAGLDLHITHDIEISPGEMVKAHTGLAIQMPEGYWGFIKERSSTALKANVTTLAGIVDHGYRGEIILALYNIGRSYAIFKAGDKVAQIIPIKLNTDPLLEVEELEDSIRGHGGFGSTGR